MAETATIDRLGHRGDGIVDEGGQQLFVPFTLPGERVEFDRDGERAELLRVLEPSADRIEPVCRHFGVCGGCQLQHLAAAPYLDFKRSLVAHAFEQRGIDAVIDPTIAVPIAGRRRVVFAARKIKGSAVLGYSQRMSHDLIDIEECPILVPEIETVLGAFRDWVAPMVSPKGDTRITVTSTTTGLDVSVESGEMPNARRISELALGAVPLNIARLTVHGEALMTRAEPVIAFDGIRVTPPPGAFIQASAASEEAMAALVIEGVGKKAKRVADLYCGTGTFALRLARKARVLAVEGDAKLLAVCRSLRRN